MSSNELTKVIQFERHDSGSYPGLSEPVLFLVSHNALLIQKAYVRNKIMQVTWKMVKNHSPIDNKNVEVDLNINKEDLG